MFPLLRCRWQKTKEWVGPCSPACSSGARANPSCPRSTTFLTRNTACIQPLCNGLHNTSMPTKCTHTPLPGIECRTVRFTPTWFSVMSSIKVHKSELLANPACDISYTNPPTASVITSAYNTYKKRRNFSNTKHQN